MGLFDRCDALLLIDIEEQEPNFFYFAGIHVGHGFYFSPKKGNSSIHVTTLDEEIARKHSKVKVELLKKGLFDEIRAMIKRKKVKKLGLSLGTMTAGLYLRLKKELSVKLVDVSKELQEMRMVKSEDELKLIRRACKVTDDVFSEVLAGFPFHSELELKHFIEFKIKERGCTLAFDPVVASGKHGSMPHYVAKDMRIRKGFLVLDFGAKHKGYCADMTRTIYVGKPSNKEIEDYQLLLNCQEMCIERVQLGMKFKDLDTIARDNLGAKAKYFIHSLGHGFGVEVHEQPGVGQRSMHKVMASVPFTIEPGIYFPRKYGIRIEDDIVVHKNGKVEILNKSSKDLILVKG